MIRAIIVPTNLLKNRRRFLGLAALPTSPRYVRRQVSDYLGAPEPAQPAEWSVPPMPPTAMPWSLVTAPPAPPPPSPAWVPGSVAAALALPHPPEQPAVLPLEEVTPSLRVIAQTVPTLPTVLTVPTSAQDLIRGLPNKYLAIGAGLFFLMLAAAAGRRR